MSRMTSRRTWWLRFSKYCWWLVFITALFLVPNLLVIPNAIQLSRLSWLDALATCALAFNVVALVVALAGSSAFTGLEALGERGTSRTLSALPRVVIFTLFLAVWLRVLRGLLRVYQVELVPVEHPWEIWTSVSIAVVLAIIFRSKVAVWVDQATTRVRFAGIVLLLLTLPLSLYLVIEPLRPGAAAPVTLSKPERERPNVVFIVVDGLASYDMSLYGYRLPTTPNLDRLARTWTVFEQAHSAATGTQAVQPTLLTGRYPSIDEWHRYGDLAREGRGVLNLAQILDTAGYHTVYGMGGGWWPGLYHLHPAFDRITGGGYPSIKYPGNIVHTFPGRDLLNLTVWNPIIAETLLLPKYGQIPASATTVTEPMYEQAVQLFGEHARSEARRPFFAYLHMNRPRPPYIGNEFLGRFLPLKAGIADVGSQSALLGRVYPPGEQWLIDRLRLRYNENILKMDQQIGALIETLQELNLYDQSLIVITADHGENFTNGYHGHLTVLLAAAEHKVPLLVKFPGQTEGRRVSAPVSTVDILPTVLDVVGAAYPRDWVDGQSLLQAGHDPQRIVYVSRIQPGGTVDSRTVAAISGDLKLVRRQGKEFLYNLADDPDEQDNQLGQVPAPTLWRALDEFVRRQYSIRAGDDFTEAPTLIDSNAGPSATEQSYHNGRR